MEKISFEPMHIEGYSQGGMVKNGAAYLTTNLYQVKITEDAKVNPDKDKGFPWVSSVDPMNLEFIQRYDFKDTYDSTPIVIKLKNGRVAVIAHEFMEKKSKAVDVETGDVIWESEDNQPGAYFFGYSYLVLNDRSGIIFVSCDNGLHAMNSENGKDIWHVEGKSGVTPCVDIQTGHVYFQSYERIYKIDGHTGNILASAKVGEPFICISWNTVLAEFNDRKYILTYWYEPKLYGSAIRIYNENLDCLSEIKNLPMSKKATLTYFQGVFYTGFGDGWQPDYLKDDTDWKIIKAFDIEKGSVLWEKSFKDFDIVSIPNIIYCDGYLICETQGKFNYQIFILNAADGEIIRWYYNDKPASSCAIPFITGGKLFSGNLYSDSMLVTVLGKGEYTDWEGAFANAFTLDMCCNAKALII